MDSQKHTVFITGAAGYIGGMLVDQLSKRDDVLLVVALDKDPKPDILVDNKKVLWVDANTSDGSWQDIVKEKIPNVVIHCAWQIREKYGKPETQWKWNVDGSRAVFEFSFKHDFVNRLIYFSTASIYGAYKTNTIEHRFTEDEPLLEEEYSYGREKKKVEEILHDIYNDARDRDTHTPQVSIVRPAAITGPRGRFVHIRFGLQSALSGQLKDIFFYRVVSFMVSYVPVTPWWVRQFIHEDDVDDIVELLSFDESITHDYEIFNICPPGEPVFAEQMAKAVQKKILPIYPWMVRTAFFVFWHISRGKIPNGRGVWRFYSYPIVMDGTKLTRQCGYRYRYNSEDAFYYSNGRYESHVPKEKRRHKRHTS